MRQHGFTLLEVLVAMVIVSIGLVGLAGLMMTSAKNNQSAYYRSQASWMGYDIIDRMRANRSVAQNGSYDISLGVSPTGCGTGVVVSDDLCQWKTELATALPTGDGSVSVSGGIATVTVSWDDRRGLGANANFAGNQAQSILIQTQL
ncbi:type IV pilus modification protein PilV [Sulfuriferula plumbiphila]|uniref:Type IV pilus modification protein PilV n=1 Tax=Sulfuriferula plumbiphila TaxID=171865 RepID=A0A512L9R6_9PROT|nr:type IV pilus modification protein PilV [Sulfuriferula plumbiphila]BBP03682.1 type IV pilus modification protein PilV [Sulfuriferula plumbiphila]GEP31192.1 type IV pilus modification protein PilV [Sulfuriferula plumbiphila]